MNTDVLTSIFTQYFHKFACLNHIVFDSRAPTLLDNEKMSAPDNPYLCQPHTALNDSLSAVSAARAIILAVWVVAVGCVIFASCKILG